MEKMVPTAHRTCITKSEVTASITKKWLTELTKYQDSFFQLSFCCLIWFIGHIMG